MEVDASDSDSEGIMDLEETGLKLPFGRPEMCQVEQNVQERVGSKQTCPPPPVFGLVVHFLCFLVVEEFATWGAPSKPLQSLVVPVAFLCQKTKSFLVKNKDPPCASFKSPLPKKPRPPFLFSRSLDQLTFWTS